MSTFGVKELSLAAVSNTFMLLIQNILWIFSKEIKKALLSNVQNRCQCLEKNSIGNSNICSEVTLHY